MAKPIRNAISTRLMTNSRTIGDAMTDLNTIAMTIDLALKHGITGQQAVNLLRQIRDQIREGQPPTLADKILKGNQP
jgi:homoaconitase/3-isopropylmalate dehydratase large subunit